MQSNSTDFSDSEENDGGHPINEELVVSNLCIICLMEKTSTYVFLSCGHAQACGYCVINFNQEDKCLTCCCITSKLQMRIKYTL